MLVLGLHGNPQLHESDDTAVFTYHDSAAAILRDGGVIAAIEEERLNRVKHSNCFPARAIRSCLAEARATIRDVDAIVMDMEEEVYDLLVTRDAILDPRVPFRSGKALVASVFEREFGVDITPKLRFCRHHMAHLSSAWHPSGFSQALAVCLDGDGGGLSGLIAHCSDEQLKVLRHIPETLSLGHFYAQMLFFLGYERFDEYKSMGLAPYGDPAVFAPLFNELYELQPDGRYQLMPPLEWQLWVQRSQLGARARRKGGPFTQEHKHFAAALQATLERIVEHIVRHFQRVTGCRHLCLSGGVAHNCTLNGRLLRSGLFDQVYVQPAAHDAGNAIGAALHHLRSVGERIERNPMPHLYLGTGIGATDEIGDRLAHWQPCIEIERVSDAPSAAARLLADGSVIGWAQGRSEFGPRALGNRSILADCRPAENKHLINAMVKKREDFRPFAPAVLEERLHEYFEVPSGTRRLPYMIFVVPVRPEAREMLGAITHVDGSARVQSVSRSDNARFHALIEAFAQLTGVPLVLNTSFNNNAEPIVDCVDDCVTTFLTTGIHAIIIGDWLIRKVPGFAMSEVVLELSIRLPGNRKLIRRVQRDGAPAHSIEPAAGRSVSATRAVSLELFRLLTEESASSIRTRCLAAGLHDPERLTSLASEIFELWSARDVQLLPCQVATPNPPPGRDR